ncbi:phosphatidylserine decarboxylase family protein [Amnibacterium sp. CER49]|uniref:phosphatidylserine decarboxylase family protein n=1 Tax=Amnibacterium sp. CER49 TaxID=3039161 RepID=UPI00244A95DB|nr:phosphatidylserine decarboxylase family protein [Amnibacterium sp. CER49]MDH2442403.1 phosphatidylserine decarboxylase family protein [Amnibacterium sp. CER49]
MAKEPSSIDVRRKAGWLPEQEDLESWLDRHRQRVADLGEQLTLHPAVARLEELVEHDPVLKMYAERMVAEAPRGKEYGQRPVESWPELLRMMSEVLNRAPEFGESIAATPLAAVLDWPSGTTAGFAFFRDARVNAALKDVLNAWCAFLDSPDSRYVLNDSPSGWLSDQARETLGMDDFEHDPEREHWGFTSWNDFFTRRLKEGARPVASPKDDKVVVSACESTPYGITMNVQRRDRFWIKTQPYSLDDMLAHDESVGQFVGGTVYQAYLSANNYHRWHSPVAGTVVRAFVQPGTYYSEADSELENATEPTNSQAYLAHVATRAIILIQADDPVLGLVAVVQIGMVEVSSCRIARHVKRGYHLDKGEELGHFQFGGSTYCLVFEPGAIRDFALDATPQPHDPQAPLKRVNTHLAVAASRR